MKLNINTISGRFKFNEHHNLGGKHAFLSPSGYHWLNYDKKKIQQSWENNNNKARGTYLHDLASRLVVTRTKLAPLKKALNLFVNDAIGFGMSSEVLLYYSDNCFGTADAIKYDIKEKRLMIFDLKTGVSKPSFSQLDIYAALFCLEYGVEPTKIEIIQRLYQGNGFTEQLGDGKNIKKIMKHIAKMDEALVEIKESMADSVFW